MKRMIAWTTLVLALLAPCGSALAAGDEPDMSKPLVPPSHPNHKYPNTGAQSATDPSAILFQWGFFYWTNTQTITSPSPAQNFKTSGDTFLFQPVIPLSKSNLLRPAIPVIGTAPTPGNDRTVGIGDLFLLDLFFLNDKHSTYGIGPVATLPTASDDVLGAGKYSLGASFVYLYKGFKKDLPGILMYNQWSVAGDDSRPDVHLLNFQIVWVHHFPTWYFGWGDQTGAINWEKNSEVDFPVGFRFGKVFKSKTPVNASIEPYYTIRSGGGRDDVYGFKISVSFIKPHLLHY